MIEKMNHTLKKTLAKLFQETQVPWANLLPSAVLRVLLTLGSDLRLSTLKQPMGGLFLLLTFTNEKVNQALRYIINLVQIQKVI